MSSNRASLPRLRRPTSLLLWTTLAVASIASGCGSGPPTGLEAPAPPAKQAKAPDSSFDPCENNPPPPKEYQGILRNARCDQDMFLTMASVAGQLGAECSFCHVPTQDDPKKFDYPAMTERKRIANWMSQHLMSSLKQKDGEPMRCRSCHTDENGKPVRKILGDPRDPRKAQEWMAMVMVNRFTKLNGDKLKCRDCHGGNYGTPEWRGKVILTDDRLPAHSLGEASF
jgi:hypothetical protein